MAKKKKRSQGQQFLSPEQYVKQRARTLKIGKCYISSDIEEAGEGHVIISRVHTGGRVSIGVYLLDIWCVGVKDSFYRLRLDEYEFEDLIESYALDLRECSYNEAHNWIYGAITFAEEAGIKPHSSFNTTQYLLEEDNDDIPLIEYEYGKDGKHFLMVKNNLEANKYLPAMKKNLGEGNYEFVINNENAWDDDDWDDDKWDDDDWDDDDWDEDELDEEGIEWADAEEVKGDKDEDKPQKES